MIAEPSRVGWNEARAVLQRRLAEPAPGRIQLLAGPRQVGKTTLLLQLAAAAGPRALYAAADGPEAALPGATSPAGERTSATPSSSRRSAGTCWRSGR